MFTKISFHNLRCFKDFTLSDLRPLTLISGRNNVGKTTVLEGVFLLLGYRHANVFQTINGWRDLVQVASSSHPWEILFSDMDAMTKQLSISATEDGGTIRTLLFSKDTQFSMDAFASDTKAQPYLHPVSESYPLKFVYTCHPGDGVEETGRFFTTYNGVVLKVDEFPHLPPLPRGVYIGPSLIAAQRMVAEWFGKVELENKKESLIKNLQFLHDEITDVFSVPTQGTISIYSRLGAGKTLPIRAMGDGINKLLHYLSAMIANPGGVFLLDEIENGFHYSFYPKLWELIARVAGETGSQVFATTHSEECISGAAEGVSKVDSKMLTYVRLGKKAEAVVPYSFSGRELASALDREMEVR